MAEPEPLVSRQELADLLRVTTKMVDKLVGEGMPSMLVGRRRRFLVSRVYAWLESEREVAA